MLNDNQLADLKEELETDPEEYGYAPHIASGAMGTLADMLNLIRPELNALRQSIPREEILACLDLTELELFPAPDLERVLFLTEVDYGIYSSGLALSQVRDICYAQTPPASISGNALGQVEYQFGASRGHWLLGLLTITWQDCVDALAYVPPE